jgi:protein-L-isoaspartate O-methyltransferase
MYAEAQDPWGFGTRWYEQRKYALTVAALPDRRYHRAFEPGCSVGVLTSVLATRCEGILATDVVEAVLQTARRRLASADPRCTIELQRWALGAGRTVAGAHL